MESGRRWQTTNLRYFKNVAVEEFYLCILGHVPDKPETPPGPETHSNNNHQSYKTVDPEGGSDKLVTGFIHSDFN